MEKVKLIFSLLLILVLILLLSPKNQRREEFVVNMSLEKRSDLFFNYEILRYPSRAEVIPLKEERMGIGIEVDPWNLNFGSIPAGNNFGKRFISLSNPQAKDVNVRFEVHGNISPFVKFSRNNFMLRAGEKERIEVYFNASSAKIGNYSGEIDVIIKVPKYDFLYKLGWLI